MALNNLRVGAAKCCISPTADMLPLSNDFGGSLYEAVREGEDIHVRAIAIDNGERYFLFESFELGALPCPEILREKLEHTYGFKQCNMLLTATHNHSAPFTTDKKIPGFLNAKALAGAQRYTEHILEQALNAAGDAVKSLKPAQFGYGEGKSYININRDQHFDDGYWMQGENWEGCSDKTISVLKFVDNENHLIAAILNYAMHSTTSFCAKDTDGKVKITCDIPGIACDYVENYFGENTVVLWQSGAAGNQNPYFVNIRQNFNKQGEMYYTNRIAGVAYEQAQVLGQQHGMDAIRAIKQIKASQKKISIRTFDEQLFFPTQRFPEKIDYAQHRLMVDNLLRLGFAGGIQADQPLPEKKLAEMIPSDEKAAMKAQMILFGDVAIFGVACELYNEIAMLCKEASPYKNLMIATHIGESIGYVLDDDSKGHKVFQSYGLVREGESNHIVVEGMLHMMQKAMNGR